MPYNTLMMTVVETPLFSRQVSDYWTEDERAEFASFIAVNFDAGNVVPGSGGVRKVRWGRRASGKSGGVRVIYFNKRANGEVWLLLIYAKSVSDNIPAHVLREIREEIEND